MSAPASPSASAAALVVKGLGHHRAGRLEQAAAAYRAALVRDGDHADALHYLALALHQKGDPAEALALIERAAARQPGNADLHANRGEVLRALGRNAEAKTCYERALALVPGHGAALYNLGIVLGEAGDHAGAEACYRRLIAADGRNVEAHFALANTLAAQGRTEAAIGSLRRALALAPGFAPAWVNLGNLERLARRPESAAECYRRAIGVAPRFAPAHLGLGNALGDLGDPEGAESCYRKALALDPGCAEAHANIGRMMTRQGDVHAAEESFRKALAGNPRQPEIAWRLPRLLPVVYSDIEDIERWRDRYDKGLADLEASVRCDSPETAEDAFLGLSAKTNFLLAYQQRDDKELQARYGQLAARVMAARFPQYAKPVPMPPRAPDGRLRVGFISEYFSDHTVARLFGTWLERFDRARFKVFVYHIGRERDADTDRLGAAADVFRHLPVYYLSGQEDFSALCRTLRADGLHALIHPEVGMGRTGFQAAALRLAPIQCVAFGHPVTTGLPNLDYFLGADLAEPPGAEAHYTEKLIRLPGIGICYPQPQAAPGKLARADFKFAPDEVAFVSPQSVFKYLPQYDRVFPAIAAQVPNARFAFLRSIPAGSDATFAGRLTRAFAAAGLDGERHFRFLPRLAGADFPDLLRAADVNLDSIGWSGGNTTLEALAAGLPTVTMPTAFMRGCYSAAMLRQMGMDDLICADEKAYVALAVRLARDPAWRAEVRVRIERNRAKLFDDDRPIRALEDFIEAAVTKMQAEDGDGGG